ncbi:CubicO group peptidase (beta-lactamase class C family) [Kribbella pratensis]|uniref:CubicO group peptidase (Beta-lactamase class C family) n=1 Tax=Kribbella pratensis TaxID=2512112 RepID=A0ABY2FBT6_9ACTN|nr:serine hydrolase domain-containing protein [Kribbella pratensis]TDW88052.1 CubicO group peptidase (beta-lactamase class C family) [Kribbella pratensis]
MQSWLDGNLADLITKHGVPAASVAVLADGEVSTAAAGILNLDTGVEATVDSVFQIGSITKLWTTTLILQLVADGKVDLDRPVRDYLPEFKLADEEAAAVITPRQLLTHTSGFSGDAFTPTSRGDDAVELFVRDVLPGLAQEVPPGAGFSYNNSGFVVLGRIAEVLFGKPFHQLIRERIAVPLGLEHVATIADEALLYRAALGHVAPKPGAPLQTAPVWSLVHAMAPAGSLLAMSARDLLTFGRSYLDATLFDRATIEGLWEPQVDVPATGGFAERWGVGWMIFDVEGGPLYGHDGGTVGQSAFFRLVPEKGVAVVLLTNGGSTGPLYDELVGHILRETAGVELPARPVPPTEPVDIAPELVAGRYTGVLAQATISVQDGEFWVLDEAVSDEARLLYPEPHRTRFVALDDTRLIAAEPEHGTHEVLAFREAVDGRATYLFRGGRLTPRSH